MVEAFDVLKMNALRLNAARLRPPSAGAPEVNRLRAPAQDALLKLRETSPLSGPSRDSFVRSASRLSELAAPAAPAVRAVEKAPKSPGAFFQTLKERLSTLSAVPAQSTALPPVGSASRPASPAAFPPNALFAAQRRQGDNPFGSAEAWPPRNQKASSGLAAVAMPLMGAGLLAVPVAAPAALAVKPTLMNRLVGAVSALFS